MPTDIFLLDALVVLEIVSLPQRTCHSSWAMGGTIPSYWTLPNLVRLVLGIPRLGGKIGNQIWMPIPKIVHLELFTPDPEILYISEKIQVEHIMLQLEVLRLENTCVTNLETSRFLAFPVLRELSLAGSNSFIGNTSRLVAAAPKLKHLNLARTGVPFDPEVLFASIHLKTLILDDMPQLFGSVNRWLWSLTSLEIVSIRNTLVHGSISPNIANLANLTRLDMMNTRITGTIPTQIGECKKLEIISLDGTSLSQPLPDTLGDLSSLRELSVSMMTRMPKGTIPNSLTRLTKLTTLSLASCSLTGMIPTRFSKLTQLTNIYLNDNELFGSIPDLVATGKSIDLHNNFLTGVIPESVATDCISLQLSHNRLGPQLSHYFFLSTSFEDFDISHNKFRAPLPIYESKFPGKTTVIMSYNQFYGTILDSYAKASALYLDHNNLTGSLDPLTSYEDPLLVKLYVGYNQLEGAINSLSNLVRLEELSIPGNRFQHSGILPDSLRIFNGAYNVFTDINAVVNSLQDFSHPLEFLDLSGNQFNPYSDMSPLIASNLTYLSLADSGIGGKISFPSFESTMEGLDLSNNHLWGEFEPTRYPNLVSLKIANNSFSGGFRLQDLPRLAELDISNNAFQFEVSSIGGLPFLLSIRAQNNPLFGSLVLDGMRGLQSADFSNTSLNYEINLDSIGLLFSDFALESLIVTKNPDIPPMELSRFEKILERTNISSPSRDYSSSVVCRTLAFSGKNSHVFMFDEDLFSYDQCDCDSVHFGMPPRSCYPCPTSGTDKCGSTHLHAERDYYVIAIRNETSQRLIRFETEPCKTLPSLKKASSDHSEHSVCRGLTYDATDSKAFPLPSVTQSQINGIQCAKGSTGRLCSRCTCDTRNETRNSECYYPYGEGCRRCSKVLKLSQSLPILFCALIVLYGAGTVVMLLVLRGRRNVSLEQWHQLSLLKRMFYRLIYLTSLGNITILVTFVQMLLEFTHWDTYMSSVVMLVMNARGDGVGIRCMFPFLADPLAGQIVQLSVPWAFVTLVGACVSSAALISHIMERRAAVGRVESSSLLDGFEDIGSPLLTRGPPRALVTYPAAALFASVSISVIKFFYFGTALSAHEYLFSSTQAFTGDKYVQNLAWLRYGDAYSVIMASIPTMLIFDFVLPISFVYVSWRVRKTFETPSVQMYFGTLFETFDRRCFWWEMVNILRKLTIALALRGISSSNLVQGSVVTSVLMGTLLIQLTVRPWKRKIENFADSASTLILIGALSTSRLEYAPNYEEVNYYVLALSVVFVIGSVVAIAFQTFFGIPSYVKQRQHLKSEDLSVQGDHEGFGDNSETEGDFVGLSRDSQQLSRKVALSHQNTSDQALLTD